MDVLSRAHLSNAQEKQYFWEKINSNFPTKFFSINVVPWSVHTSIYNPFAISIDNILSKTTIKTDKIYNECYMKNIYMNGSNR